MSARDEFARDVFLADNFSALAGVAEKDWCENREHHDYAYEIADRLIAKGYTRAPDESQIELEMKRVIALIVLESGGKVAVSRRAINDLSDETVIETKQDVISGGWVIRAIAPSASAALDAISDLGSDDPAEGFQKVRGRGAKPSTREP